MVKELAQTSSIDTTKLDGQPTDQLRQKWKLICGESSVPSTPTPAIIKYECKNIMVESGEVSLRVSCVPCKKKQIVFGRKFPLLDLRKKFLTEHKHLQTDEDINTMSLYSPIYC